MTEIKFANQKILFVSEIGAGRGHMARIVAVAKVAKSLGFRTELAIHPRNAALYTSAGHDFDKVVQSPSYPILRNPPDEFKVSGLAEALALFGMIDHRIITRVVSQWQSLIRNCDPDFIVGDYAPYARLASLNKVPFLMVGSGYTIPSSEELTVFTGIRGFKSPAALGNLVKMEINKALEPSLIQISGAGVCLRGDYNLVACAPLFDPAVGRDPSEYIGPMEVLPIPDHNVTPSKKIYVYTHGVRDIDRKYLGDLIAEGYEVSIYSDGKGTPPEGCQLLDKPFPLALIPQNASAVYHQGGLGLSTICLTFGMPQILSPKHTEARMSVAKLTNADAGYNVESKTSSTAELVAWLNDHDKNRRIISQGADLRKTLHELDWQARVPEMLRIFSEA